MDEVRHAVGIARIVEEHVALKRAGRTLKGLCPFHGEKTPSFHVDEAKGFYHCFGCGAGGDVFRFVMQLESLSFPEAVRHLAEKAGLRVPERRGNPAADALRDRLFAINEAAQQAFSGQLREAAGREAVAYLAGRGIGPDVSAAFGLGWAPDSWDFLARGLAGRFEQRELTAAGVLSERASGGAYDRFRARVTFPIRAVSGRILGFGGRLLGPGEPKYLNSPETPLYTKGRHLYALDRARTAIRRTGRAVLVEGYLDAISLHAHGVEDAVAVLGTALTAEQARLLGRFTRRVVLAMDGDAAGLRAARRSIEVLLAEGLEVRVLALPQGRDPDDHVRAVGGERFAAAVDAAPHFFEFLLQVAAAEHDLGSPTGRVAALNDVLPHLVKVEDRVLRAELADATCHGLGLRAELVRDEVARALKRGGRVVEVQAAEAAAVPAASYAERSLIAWMLDDERVRDSFRRCVDGSALDALPHGAIFRAILDHPAGRVDTTDVLARLGQGWEREIVARCAVSHPEPPPVGLTQASIDERVAAFVDEMAMSPRHEARRMKGEVDRLAREAQARGDREEWLRLQAQAQELARAMHR